MKTLFQKKTLTKSLSALLAIVMILSALAVIPFTATADSNLGGVVEVWDGTTVTEPLGAGTEEDPLQIKTAANFAWMANEVNNARTSYYGKYILQTADLDFGGHDFVGIGYRYRSVSEDLSDNDRIKVFRGTYDGNGYKIMNANVLETTAEQGSGWYHSYARGTATITLNRRLQGFTAAGLFGATYGATIKNVTAKNVTVGSLNNAATKHYEVYNNLYAGVIVGGALCTTVENCVVESDCHAYGLYGAGGICGFSECSTFKSCVNNAETASCFQVGGVVGFGFGLEFLNCVNNGHVWLYNPVTGRKGLNNDWYWAGGILGGVIAWGANDVKVTTATEDGKIVVTPGGTRPAQQDTRIGKLLFNGCINTGVLEVQSCETDTTQQIFIGGIVPHGISLIQEYVFQNCYNVAPFYSTCATENTSVVRAGSIFGQIGSGWNNTYGSINDCHAGSDMKYYIYDNTSTTRENPWTKVNLANYPFQPFVCGCSSRSSDAGNTTYWRGDPATCSYNKTFEELKATDGYKAILTASHTVVTPRIVQKAIPAIAYRGCQESKVDAEGNYDVRLIAVVDSTEYEGVGFRLTVVSTGLTSKITNRPFPCKTVYNTLTGNADGTIVSYTIDDFGGEGYLMALSLRNLNTAMLRVTVTVEPYVVDAGEIKYGTCYEVVYNNGQFVSQTVVNIAH